MWVLPMTAGLGTCHSPRKFIAPDKIIQDYYFFFKFLMSSKLILEELNQAPALHSWIFIFATDSHFFISSTSLERCSNTFWSFT